MILHQLRNSRGEIFVTISIDLENGWVKDVWSGSFESQENFRLALETITEVIQEYKLTKWLADLRGMKGSWDFNRSWVVKELVPKALQAGLRYEAIVLPKEIFSKLSTIETMDMLENYTLSHFNSLEKAEEWLNGVDS